MATEVDWNWQIQHKPDFFNSWAGIDPSAGPYDDLLMVFDQAQGYDVSTSTLGLRLASLIQQGVIGTNGDQQLQGTLQMVGWGSSPVTPGGQLPGYALWLLDGGVTWMDDSSSAPANAVAEETFGSTLSTGYGWQMLTWQDIYMLAGYGSTGHSVVVATPDGGSLTIAGGDPVTPILSGPAPGLQIGSTASILQLIQGPTGVLCDISGDDPEVGFSLYGGTVIGVTTGMWDGSAFSGGLLTTAGAIPPIMGDVTGDLSASELTSIQGNPVLAPTPSIGDVLEWNGTDWITAPGGGGGLAIGSPVSGGTPGDTLQVDGSGNLGQWIPWEILQAGGSVVCDSSGGVTAASAAITALYADPFGDVILGGTHGTISLPNNGAVLIQGQVGGHIGLDNSGAITGTPQSGTTLQFSSSDSSSLFFLADLGVFVAYQPSTSASFSLAAGGQMIASGNGGGIYTSAGGLYAYSSAGGVYHMDGGGNITLTPGFGGGIGVFSTTPAVQYTPTAYASGFTPNTSANFLFNESTWDGGLGGSAYSINDLVRSGILYGWLAP